MSVKGLMMLILYPQSWVFQPLALPRALQCSVSIYMVHELGTISVLGVCTVSIYVIQLNVLR